MWPRDDVDADKLAFDRFDRLRSGIGRRFDRCDIADNDGRDQRIADLSHLTGEFHICSLEHRVRAFDECDEAACFNQSNCLMGHKLFDG